MSEIDHHLSPQRKRGPKRLEYIPEQYRNIPGIENVTTARQLQNLKTWLDLPAAEKPVFIKLGCSVSHGQKRLLNPPSSTWVAVVNGDPQIVHIVKDPRSAWKWMSNAARPWNLAHQHQPKAEATKFWIAVMERTDGYALEPNSDLLHLVTSRKIRRGPFEGKMELLVEAPYGWWENVLVAGKVLRQRAAFGEIFAGEDGSYWVTASQVRTFPPHSYADWSLMEDNREPVADIDQYLEDRAVERIWHKISLVNVAKPIPAEDDAIVRSILRKKQLDHVTTDELDELVPLVADLLSTLRSGS